MAAASFLPRSHSPDRGPWVLTETIRRIVTSFSIAQAITRWQAMAARASKEARAIVR